MLSTNLATGPGRSMQRGTRSSLLSQTDRGRLRAPHVPASAVGQIYCVGFFDQVEHQSAVVPNFR